MASSSSSFRFFTIEQAGDATIARPVDPHLQGTAVAELIKLELMQIFETTGCKTAIIDLHNVKLVSSSVISSLLGVKRHLTVNGIPLVLCGMSESLRYVFKTLNMDGSVFNIVDTVEDALASTDKSPAYYSNVCDRLSPPDDENA